MSGQENNYKYIAEAWFNDEKEYEFKRAFLESLIKQYQGHGNNFDADTVDGKHYQDITDEISLATNNMMTSFEIGDTLFSQENNAQGDKYYLDLRAIKLYPESNHRILSASINSELPWNYTSEYYTGKSTSAERMGIADSSDSYNPPNPDLFTILREIYYLLHTNKVSVNTFTNLRTRVTDLENSIGNLQTHSVGEKLNADSVNGLQFYVVTQEQYQNDYTAEQRQDVHNVFIIKDASEIPGGRYEGNPTFPSFLNDGYEFAIQPMNIPTANDPTTLEERICLVYRIKSPVGSEVENEWSVIAPTDDFIDENYINNLVQENRFELTVTTMDYGYRLPVKIYGLRDYQKNDTVNINDGSYAIPEYVKNNYLFGARVHELQYIQPVNTNSSGSFIAAKIEGTDTTDYKFLGREAGSTNLRDGYVYLQLDSVIQNIKQVMNSRFNTIDGYINNIRTSANTSEEKIPIIEEDVSSHSTSISNIQSSLGDKPNKAWQTYLLDGINVWMKQYSNDGGNTYPFLNKPSFIRFNSDLKLAYIELHFVHRTSFYFNKRWRGIGTPKSYWYNNGSQPLTVEQGESYEGSKEVPRGTGIWEIYTTYEIKQGVDYQNQNTSGNNSFNINKVPDINYPNQLSSSSAPQVSESAYAASPYIPSHLLPQYDIILSPIMPVSKDANWPKVRISSVARTLRFNSRYFNSSKNNGMDELFNSSEWAEDTLPDNEQDYTIQHRPGEVMVWYNEPTLSKNTSESFRARDIKIDVSGFYKIKESKEDMGLL